MAGCECNKVVDHKKLYKAADAIPEETKNLCEETGALLVVADAVLNSPFVLRVISATIRAIAKVLSKSGEKYKTGITNLCNGILYVINKEDTD